MTSVSALTYSSEYKSNFVFNNPKKFGTVPTKKVSPLSRGGTLLRRNKKHHPRRSTTPVVSDYRFSSIADSFNRNMLFMPSEFTDRSSTNTIEDGDDNASNATLTSNKDAVDGDYRRSNKINQSFFRKKKPTS